MSGPKYFLACSVLVIVVIVGFRYYQYVIERNFTVLANISCDPTSEVCFVSDCSPEDVGCDLTPYKKVSIRASDAPKCIEEHNCEAFSCDGISTCMITYCNDSTIEEGEVCADAVVIKNDSPAEEISSLPK